MPEPKLEDLESIDAIIRAWYASISFPAGKLPDYRRLRTLFHSGARITPPRADDALTAEVLDVESFLERSQGIIMGSELERRGFVQQEVFRSVEGFGNVAHVLSTYESRLADERQPFERGINSVQLLKQGHGWEVLNMMWEIERKDLAIPDEYTRGDA